MKLLVVFLSEIGTVGHRYHKELVHYRGDTLEMAGAQRSAQSGSKIRYSHGRELWSWIHFVPVGRKDYTAAGHLKLAEISRFVTRIGCEILVGAKLCRIHKDRRHRHVTAVDRAMHDHSKDMKSSNLPDAARVSSAGKASSIRKVSPNLA